MIVSSTRSRKIKICRPGGKVENCHVTEGFALGSEAVQASQTGWRRAKPEQA